MVLEYQEIVCLFEWYHVQIVDNPFDSEHISRLAWSHAKFCLRAKSIQLHYQWGPARALGHQQ